MRSLNGAVAIVTGGASGMGASHARGLIANAASVVVADVNDQGGLALVDELGSSARFFHLDVTNETEWNEAVATAESLFGPVSVLVNNAGMSTWGAMTDMSSDVFRRTIDVNLVGTWLGMRAVAPSMKRAGGGAIVNISSTAGLLGYPNMAAYVASKWGVRGLTKSAALELAPDIRVNAIMPGAIDTPMMDGITMPGLIRQPIPRMGETDEVTAMLLFILTQATYTTGHDFVIDGGSAVGSVAPSPPATPA